jgi:hypothetical protein
MFSMGLRFLAILFWYLPVLNMQEIKGNPPTGFHVRVAGYDVSFINQTTFINIKQRTRQSVHQLKAKFISRPMISLFDNLKARPWFYQKPKIFKDISMNRFRRPWSWPKMLTVTWRTAVACIVTSSMNCSDTLIGRTFIFLLESIDAKFIV